MLSCDQKVDKYIVLVIGLPYDVGLFYELAFGFAFAINDSRKELYLVLVYYQKTIEEL